MATRLVLDKLDLDLAAFTAGLPVIVVVVVFGSRARSLDAAVFGTEGAVAIAGVVMGGRGLGIVVGDFGRHCGQKGESSSEDCRWVGWGEVGAG